MCCREQAVGILVSTTGEIVIRAKSFELLPDVEHYIQHLKDNEVLEKLANEKRLTVKELQKSSLGKMCNIFAENMGHDLEPGDVIVFFLILATLRFLKDKHANFR